MMRQEEQPRENASFSVVTPPPQHPISPVYPTVTPAATSAPSSIMTASVLSTHAAMLSTLVPASMPAVLPSLTLAEILTASTLYDSDPLVLGEKICRAFNKHVTKSCFEKSLVRGIWLNPGELLLGHRNKIPELAMFDKSRNIAATWPNPVGVVTDYILTKRGEPFKQSDLFFGAFGSYVLNVPPGKFAKAKSGNQPVLFGPGPHVIHDRTFSFDPQTGLVDQATDYVKHETLHIIRVCAGQVAKVWFGTIPVLLESRPEPYIYNTALLRIDMTEDGKYFFDATENIISHGSIKRLMPCTGEVAVTYNNGMLQIIEPKLDSRPTVIDSQLHKFDSFLCTAVQNLELPSAAAKARRLKDNPKASTDELTYEIFSTRDSVKLGVKLYVAYSIKNPQLALSQLRSEEGILNHIESCATVDMGMAIQQCTSQEFLNSYQTKPAKTDPYRKELQSMGLPTPSAPPLFEEPETIQDKVKKKLSNDLADFGIELVRLNFETPKMIDAELAKQMSQQSLRTAEASSQGAVLEQNFHIAMRKAEQEAMTLRIKQEQLNQAKISQAQAELDAAKLSAEAAQIKAEADRKSGLSRGQQFIENPKLFELEMFRIQMEAVAKAQFVPPQLAGLLSSGMFNTPFNLFGANPAAGASAAPKPVIQASPEAPRPSS